MLVRINHLNRIIIRNLKGPMGLCMKYCLVIKDSKLTVTDPRLSIQMIGRKSVNQIQKGMYLIHKIEQHLCVIVEINLSMIGLAEQLMVIIK